MNLFLDNVNLYSTSGPNHFASKLTKYMSKLGVTFDSDKKYDSQLSFIYKVSDAYNIPIYQRLDGIYFNSEQEFNTLNKPILRTYQSTEGVIFQSQFNKDLTFKYFGEHKNYKIIHNGADLEFIQSVGPLEASVIDQYQKVWSCASSWRPHKRLSDNIRYFLEHSSEDECMVVAGHVNEDQKIPHSRVYYTGQLDVRTLIALYKKSDYFVHLAYLDHCPNVVVDAVACGCHVICSSSGGTKEVAVGGTIIEEEEWGFEPVKLYSPPRMDFTKKKKNNYTTNIDMNYVSSKYYKFMGGK